MEYARRQNQQVPPPTFDSARHKVFDTRDYNQLPRNPEYVNRRSFARSIATRNTSLPSKPRANNQGNKNKIRYSYDQPHLGGFQQHTSYPPKQHPELTAGCEYGLSKCNFFDRKEKKNDYKSQALNRPCEEFGNRSDYGAVEIDRYEAGNFSQARFLHNNKPDHQRMYQSNELRRETCPVNYSALNRGRCSFTDSGNEKSFRNMRDSVSKPYRPRNNKNNSKWGFQKKKSKEYGHKNDPRTHITTCRRQNTQGMSVVTPQNDSQQALRGQRTKTKEQLKELDKLCDMLLNQSISKNADKKYATVNKY